MTYAFKNLSDVQQAAKDWKQLQGETGKSIEQIANEIARKEDELAKTSGLEERSRIQKQLDNLKEQKTGQSKAEMKMKNLHRMVAEIGVILLTFMLKGIFASLWDDADEDGAGTRKRFQNAFMYQLDRQRREMLQFIWWKDGYELMKSPISSMRMVKEMAEAFSSTVQTPFVLTKHALTGKDPSLNKNIYYQRGNKKGTLKMWKEQRDAMPLLYALNRWMSYDRVKNYWTAD
jgi:hypothetical protein